MNNNVIETFDEFERFENVTSLGGSNASYRWAFAGCTNLKSITLPPNLTKLYNGTSNYNGVGVFYGCTSLTRVENLNVLQEIGSYAFFNCTSLAFDELNLSNLTTLGQNAFYGVKIKKINLALTTLPNASGSTQNFGDKETLEEVIFSGDITSIPSYSFCDYKTLTNCSLPNSVTTIGGSAFKNCIAISTINLENVITINDDAFWNANVEGELYLPNLSGRLGRLAFANTPITSVTNLGSITDLSSYDL